MNQKEERKLLFEHIRSVRYMCYDIDFEELNLKDVINIRLDLLEVAEDLKYDIRRMKDRRYIERKRLYKVETIEKV